MNHFNSNINNNSNNNNNNYIYIYIYDKNTMLLSYRLLYLYIITLKASLGCHYTLRACDVTSALIPRIHLQ